MYDQVAANKRRAGLLVVSFVVVVTVALWAVVLLLGGGVPGLVLGLAVSGGLALAAYGKSDVVALALSRARPADPVAHARLHNLVEGLCIAAGLPKPQVFVVDDPGLNAFSTGRSPKHASIAVTTGLTERLSRIELEGVLAHELSHVKNYDTLVSTLAVTMLGWLATLGGAVRPLATLANRLTTLVMDRRRETLADLSGVSLTRYPPGLISALEKLGDGASVVTSGSRATAHLWMESPLDERMAALREL